MKSPCEVIVWDVLPSIRAAIADELVKKGLSQKEVSRLLGITPPAVSQYVSKKRGCNIQFAEEPKKSIERLADDLIQGRVENLTDRICDICKSVREDDTACVSSKCQVTPTHKSP
jgi:predicted transcriptional regulator